MYSLYLSMVFVLYFHVVLWALSLFIYVPTDCRFNVSIFFLILSLVFFRQELLVRSIPVSLVLHALHATISTVA